MSDLDPPAAPSPGPPPASAPGPRDFTWFSLALASWFAAFGMQSTLFSWLLVGELGASDELVGIAQTANMLPSILLLMVGGAAADRVDPRRLLIGLHLVGVLPVLALATTVSGGGLSVPVIMGFGISMGIITAFSMPARDTLLSRVAGNDMMHAVTTMTAVQFGSQAVGALLAGSARWFGSVPLIVAQALVLASGVLFALRIPAVAPAPRAADARSALHEMTEGLAQAFRNPLLRSPLLLVIAVGFFFVGPFMVTFPIIVTRYYEGTIADLSVVMMLFPLGTIAGSMLLRQRGVRRKGMAALWALVFGAFNLAVVGFGFPFPVMVVATMAWGLAGAFFINCSRTLYQQAAPAEQRGRVLAVYQMGFMGAAPLGATSAGFLSGQIGALSTLHAYAAAMLVVVVFVHALTDLAKME